MPTRPLVTSYEQDQKLFPDFWHKIALVLGGTLTLFFPFLASAKWISIGNMALTSVVGAVGLMILTGFTGQISLGHAAFLAVGAYTVAVLGQELQLPFWLGIPLAGIAATLVGLAIGPFALRLRGLYLAIVTLGLIFIVNHMLLSFPEITGGVSGIAVPMHTWFPPDGAGSFGSFQKELDLGVVQIDFAQKLYFLFLFLAVISAYVSRNIQRSNLGRAMVAVRDHDLAAAVLGVHPAKTKIISFAVSSFFAGVAGAMFAFQQQYITVEPPFDLNMSIQYIAIIVLGGIGTTFGAVAGAIAYVVLSPIAELLGEYIPLLSALSSAQQSTLVFAVVVILFLVFEPLGLFGIWLRIKRYFIAWPFRY